MIKLLPLLLILFISVTNSTFGQKGKSKKSPEITIKMSNGIVDDNDLKKEEVTEYCNEHLESIQIFGDNCDYYSIIIYNDDNNEILLKSVGFRPCNTPGSKLTFMVHPWLPWYGQYKVYIGKYELGNTPEINEKQIVSFRYSSQECGD